MLITRRVLAVLILLAGMLTVTATAANADSTYNETVGGPTDTWTNYSNAGGYQGATIPAYQSVQVQCWISGYTVASGNSYWYQIASPPWNDQYYASADAFYNNGSTSGSLRGTPFVDPAVAQCGTSSPPPPVSSTSVPAPNPSIQLAQGATAPLGYWYAIALNNFSANSSVTVSCSDSVSSNFRSFQLETDGNGNASTSSECYSNDGPEHWVDANGVESNYAPWGARSSSSESSNSSGSGQGSSSSSGKSATTPPASSSSAAALPTTCENYTGRYIEDSGGLSVAAALYQHYLWGHGAPVVVDWTLFSSSTNFKNFAEGLPVGEVHLYRDSPNTDMFWALGTFTTSRELPNCYSIYDHYDFTPRLASPFSIHGAAEDYDTYVTLPDWAAQLVGAQDFDVRSSGSF